jgi:hypothetical protein
MCLFGRVCHGALIVLSFIACDTRSGRAIVHRSHEKEPAVPNLDESLRNELVVIPGESIGPISLGMRSAQLRLQKLVITPEPSNPPDVETAHAGPLRIVLNDDVVVSIELDIAAASGGVRVAGKRVPAASSIEGIAALLADCGPIEQGEGGRTIRCSSGRTLVKQGSDETARVIIQVITP